MPIRGKPLNAEPGGEWGYLVGLLLLLPMLACIRVNRPEQVGPIATLTPSPTPIIWPTLSPRRPAPAPVVKIKRAEPLCPWPDLLLEQHLTASGSYTRAESMTVGWMQCHIKRNSCAYNRLVGKVDPSIVFKREETPPFDTEDILTHPAMVEPLSRLNELVLAEWRGAFQLRVTDAYDSLLEHDPPDSEPSRRYSLHYEGRAIDLTLWPVDQSRYGRLCVLAHCAGFDWVMHEGTHCHASIAATSLCEQCGP